MPLILSALEVVWEFVKRHPGIVCVFIGVFGEIALEWKHTVEPLAWLKKFFWLLLVFGLAWEFVDSAKSDKQVAELNLHIEELRKSNDTFEAKLQMQQTRRITEAQKDAFIKNTKDLIKGPVRIFVCAGDFEEPMAYARNVREMLDEAGYAVKNGEGITQIKELSYALSPIGDFGKDVPLFLCVYGKNLETIAWPGIYFVHTGDVITANYNIKGSNVPLPGVVYFGFYHSGITATWTVSDSLVKEGEWGITIPRKF